MSYNWPIGELYATMASHKLLVAMASLTWFEFRGLIIKTHYEVAAAFTSKNATNLVKKKYRSKSPMGFRNFLQSYSVMYLLQQESPDSYPVCHHAWIGFSEGSDWVRVW